MGWEHLEEVCAHLHGRVGDYVYRYYPGIALQRVPYYTPTNPRTGKQQTWRKIFAEGIAAWHALSEEEKEEWRQKAKKKRMVGQHLFQSVWLKAHPLTGDPFTVGTTVIGGYDYIIVGEPLTIGAWTVGSHNYIIVGPPITIGKWQVGSIQYVTGP